MGEAARGTDGHRVPSLRFVGKIDGAKGSLWNVIGGAYLAPRYLIELVVSEVL